MPSNPTWLPGPSGARKKLFGPKKQTGLITPQRIIMLVTLILLLIFIKVSFKLMKPKSSNSLDEADYEEVAEYEENNREEIARLVNEEEKEHAVDMEDVEEEPEPEPKRKRTIVLSTGNGRFNTGVWPSWGGDNPKRSVLNWAAAGVVVDKSCSVECTFIHENSEIDLNSVDAIVMETINHPKFGISESIPLPFPQFRTNPLLEQDDEDAPKWLKNKINEAQELAPKLPAMAVFYYEAAQSYPHYTLSSSDIKRQFPISLTPDQSSTLPIGMACPWGRSVPEYLKPAPKKEPGRLIAYFNEHGVAFAYNKLVNEFFDIAKDDLHAYIHRRNRPVPDEAGGNPYQLSNRLNFLGTYKFHLVTEAIEEKDWVEPELSQTFLAGTVPVYIGAPNANDFAPGPRSFIHMRDFSSPQALWDYLLYLDQNDEAYQEYFAWKVPARAAHREDEGGEINVPGTGVGVRSDMDQSDSIMISKLMKNYASVPDNKGDIATLKDIVKSNGEEDLYGLSKDAWRRYRIQLDRCVHYAECRICELITRVTPE